MASEILAIVRNKAQVVNAGALTIPMDSRELELVKQVSDVTAYWRGELEAITPSQMTFEMQTFRAHTVAAIVTLSEELLADAKNFGPMLEQSLGSALALALDKACLVGGGVVQPLGVINTPGVQTTGAVGTLADYADFSEAAGKLWAANFTPTALLFNAKIAAKLDALVDGEERPLTPPASWGQYAHLMTNQIEESGGTSTAILGAWKNLWIALRQEVKIEFNRSATVDSVNAFSQLAVHVRCWMRVDAAVVRPSAFVLIPGITTT
jgi:HK97 family phage major capsid protein